MYSLVVATRNKNKLAELSQACGPGLLLEPLPKEAREVKEGTVSLEENATLKAISAVADLGRPALADDTGFFVDALDGRPGVLSARFGGLATDGERRQLVLKLLESVEPARRAAHYETVLCLAFPDGRQLVARASVYGTVPRTEQGTGGFGYDAVFIPAEGTGLSFAEMTTDEKNAMSHRGRAMRAMLDEHADAISDLLQSVH